MKKITPYLVCLISIFALSACGGGGGSSSTSSSSSSSNTSSGVSTYQAGVTIGDNGVLEIDRNTLKYTLTIQNSSFALGGKTFTGSITPNADGG